MTEISPDLLGELPSRYEIIDVVGEGGGGVVYSAHDRQHDRPVAIKVLKPSLTDDTGARRFLREIQVAASLTHPLIVPVHESGQSGDLLYFVMPLVEGRP